MVVVKGNRGDLYPPVCLMGEGVYAEARAAAILNGTWDDRLMQRLRTRYCGRAPVGRPMCVHREEDLMWTSMKGRWKGLAFHGEYGGLSVPERHMYVRIVCGDWRNFTCRVDGMCVVCGHEPPGLRHMLDACGGKRYWERRLGRERLDLDLQAVRIEDGLARKVLRLVEKRRENPPQRMCALVGSFPEAEWRTVEGDGDVVIRAKWCRRIAVCLMRRAASMCIEYVKLAGQGGAAASFQPPATNLY